MYSIGLDSQVARSKYRSTVLHSSEGNERLIHWCVTNRVELKIESGIFYATVNIRTFNILPTHWLWVQLTASRDGLSDVDIWLLYNPIEDYVFPIWVFLHKMLSVEYLWSISCQTFNFVKQIVIYEIIYGNNAFSRMTMLQVANKCVQMHGM